MAEEIRFNELANVGELSPSAIVAIVQEQQGELVSLQCSAAQIADLIVNGIQFQALTSEDKKIVGAINESLAKVDDLELFKFPNATIIGTPTINNGQISGFSQTSYLQFPFLMDFQGRHFAINMEFTTAADVTNQQNIFDSDFGLAFAIRSGKFVIAVSSNGTSWNIGEGVGTHTVLSNTTYRVQLAWDGTAYKLAYSVNGGESYTEDISLASTASPFPKQVYIGVGENYASVLNFFKGIINLNYASLYVADSLVWQGMDDVGLASRLATDLSNIDAAGEQRIKGIAGGGGGGSNVTMTENPAGGVDLTVENQKQTLAKQEDLAAEFAEIQQLTNNLSDTDRSLEMLWKLNKGQTYDFLEKVETGINIAPTGAKYESLLEVRGNSIQDGIPTPTNPVDIVSVEQINISVDGTVRTVIPPSPLNKIGDYYDFADIDKGVWFYHLKSVKISDSKSTIKSGSTMYDRYICTMGDIVSGPVLCSNMLYKTDITKPNMANMIGYDTVNGGRLIFDFPVGTVPNISTFNEITTSYNILYASTELKSEPINDSDLAYFKSLHNLDKSVNIAITDQDGNDISYLMEYIIKLNEVN